MSDLPTEAWLSALAGLTDMGPTRLTRLLAFAPATEAWAQLVGGADLGELAAAIGRSGPRLVARWRSEARLVDVAGSWSHLRSLGVGVAAFGGSAYPDVLRADPEPPAVLFHLGNPDQVRSPRVAIVGTRQCSRYGSDVAEEFGMALAEAGVSVVSGLALGIDAAAHRGALRASSAAPVAVVGSGLDVVYPRANRELWADVARRGVVYSEASLGVSPAPWRFPARNRIIAALADLVIVVESHRRGGSMHTVAEAVARDRQVMAVPGPIRSAASAGTNQLLAEGCAPACDVDDVLMALGLGSSEPSFRHAEPDLPPDEERLLGVVGWVPWNFADLVDAVGDDPAKVAATIASLVASGRIVQTGSWIERSAPGG